MAKQKKGKSLFFRGKKERVNRALMLDVGIRYSEFLDKGSSHEPNRSAAWDRGGLVGRDGPTERSARGAVWAG